MKIKFYYLWFPLFVLFAFFSCGDDDDKYNNNVYNGEGNLVGKFSVSENKQICFSKGNLQYQASTNTWRFAEHQYDIIGWVNKNISATYSGWIDLFGWGTSGYKQLYPYETSDNNNDYGNIESSNLNLGTNDIDKTYNDWGRYNAISNGGNVKKVWRTLTFEEWIYLCEERPHAESLISVGVVNGVNGCLLLPDGWTLPTELSFIPQADDYSENVYTQEQWTKMERVGAVFLPCAGERWGNYDIRNVNDFGAYWTSSSCGSDYHEAFYFRITPSSSINGVDCHSRRAGLAVRLVTD